jgi:hypothetical protein
VEVKKKAAASKELENVVAKKAAASAAAAKEFENVEEAKRPAKEDLENVKKATRASSKWGTIVMESSNNVVEDDDEEENELHELQQQSITKIAKKRGRPKKSSVAESKGHGNKRVYTSCEDFKRSKEFQESRKNYKLTDKYKNPYIEDSD